MLYNPVHQAWQLIPAGRFVIYFNVYDCFLKFTVVRPKYGYNYTFNVFFFIESTKFLWAKFFSHIFLRRVEIQFEYSICKKNYGDGNSKERKKIKEIAFFLLFWYALKKFSFFFFVHLFYVCLNVKSKAFHVTQFTSLWIV